MNYPSNLFVLIVFLSNLLDFCTPQSFVRRRKLQAELIQGVSPEDVAQRPSVNPIILESTQNENESDHYNNTSLPESVTSDTPTSTINNNTTQPDDLSPSEKEFIEEFMEKEEEIIKKKEEIVAEEVGGISMIIGIAFMIFTAWQMSENPDGVCASLCRLTFTVAGCFVKILLWPFKKMCGHRFSGYAHHLVATQDYGETSMFQIS
jgi:hypothetical protein